MLTTKFNTQPIGKKKFLYILTILTVFFLLCNIFFLKKIVYAGSGFYLLGSGPRSTGRGGADIAVADDTFSINLNPAGMKNINGKRLDIALSPGVAQTHFENKYNDTDGDPFYFALPNVGYVNNDKRLAYGLALSVPSGLGTSYSVNHPLYEKKIDLKDNFSSIRAAIAASYPLTSRLTIGVAPSLTYNRLYLKMPSPMSLDTLRSISKGIAFNETTFGDLFTDIGVNEVNPMSKLRADSFSYGFTLGLLYDINSKLTIGASYVSRQHFELEGNLKLNANRQIDALKPDVIPLLSLLPNQGQNGLIGKWDIEIPYVLPQKAGIGLSYRPTEKWMVAFDVTWIDWKDFLGGDWVVKLSNGNSEDLNAIVGSPDFTSSFPQKWSNGIISSFGVEHQLSPVCILRAGYATGNRIVPSNTITPVGPVISKHHLTFGTGYKFEIFEFNIAYEHILKNSSSRVQSHQVSSFYEDARTSVSVNTVHMMCSWHF